jgi:hypothetical protein
MVRLVSCGYRNCEIKCTAFAMNAIEPDMSPLHFYEMASDIQAESGAGYIAYILIAGTEEFVEYLSTVLRGYPVTRIIY